MSERIADFHALRERLRLGGIITTRTALRIGSGGDDLNATDLPVLRDPRGYPFIPGSSLKGVIRSTLEALVRGAALGARGTPQSSQRTELRACDPLSNEACGYHDQKKRSTVDIDSHCAICQLFGSNVLASHVRFSDALIVQTQAGQATGLVPIEVRDGVAINRDLRVAQGQAKFDFEVVSPGTRFALEIFIENPRPWGLGLLLLGLDQLREGFTALGGFTSRGMGRIDLTLTERVRSTASALLAGEPPQRETDLPALDMEFQGWRRALGDYAGGQS